MIRMKIGENTDFKELTLLQDRAAEDWSAVDQRVRTILQDVKQRGDEALRSWTEELDGFRPEALSVPPQELQLAWDQAEPELKAILEEAAQRIRRFHSFQLERSWTTDSEPGICLGQKVTPLDRVGIYVPGGKAAYPSTVLMNVIPAQVAGVREIALFTPADQTGSVNPLVLAAARMLGIQEIYRLGGAQAIGAMAYGTESIPPVDKITGPGNAYVARAKREVFGVVGIDMIAGPSEVLIVADGTADPQWIAADLLAQAEHDEMAAAILVTTDPALLDAVDAAVAQQLALLPRADIASKALENYGCLILADSLALALEISNRLAPEHLELMVGDPWEALKSVRHAGAVFLGANTPEALGDYMAGPNHTLPTSGTARFASPLGVYDFIKRTSILQFDPAASSALSDSVSRLARAEGLTAHARSAEMRKQ